MENLYPCSFKCLKSVAVIVCLYSPPFLFFISRTVFFSLHRIFNTFSQTDVLFTVFGFLEYMYIFLTFLLLFCDKIKSLFAENHGHFLKFVVKTALIWLVLDLFFGVFSQSKTMCNLHSCYNFALVLHQFALVLQKSCTPFWANQNWVIFSCILLVLQNCEILHSVRGLHDKNSASWYYFTSDVMYKKYERLVYTSLDLLVRFCKVNLSNAKNAAWFVFQEFVFQA